MSDVKRWWIAPKLIDPIDPVEPSYFYAYDLPGAPSRLEIEVVSRADYDSLFSRYEHSETKVQWLLHDSQKLVKERDELKAVLKALSERHDWLPAMGQCICREHQVAREVLARDEAKQGGDA